MLLNITRARKFMDEHGLDALVAASPENVTYVSGFANWTLYTFQDLVMFAVLPREGDLRLVAAIDAADYLAQVPVATTHTYFYGTFHTERDPDAVLTGAEQGIADVRANAIPVASAFDGLKRALADAGVNSGRIGVDERRFNVTRWNQLTEQLSRYDVSLAGDLFRSIRLIKTEEEIERLRTVVSIVESGMQAAFEAAAPGVSEWDLESVFRSTIAATGGTPGHFETSAGTRSSGCFPSSKDYQLKMGDVVRSDAGGRNLAYWADSGRTRVLGQAPDRLVAAFTALSAGIDAILAEVKPGVPVSTLFTAGVEAVRGGGIPGYKRHHVGHGIGLEMYEAPILAPADPNAIHSFGGGDPLLEPGMVVNVELPYYELGLGGLQIEETLVIRDDGYDLLSAAPRQLLSLQD
ncbi:MAG: aminopeptidase P family protein [Thermomicrobiales bacterium]|nr:aminopeptidase P family protein [Thermomicrobiales bacterium]